MLELLRTISDSWASTLWGAIWQASIAVVLMLSIESCLPRLSAGVRNWLWRLVYVKIAFALLFPNLFVVPVLPRWPVAGHMQSATAKSLDFGNKSLLGANRLDAGSVNSFGEEDSTAVTASDANVSSGSILQHGTTQTPSSWTWSMMLLILWSVILYGRWVHFAWQWTWLARTLKRTRKPAGPALHRALRDVLRRFGIRKKVRIRVIEGSGSPFVVGIFRSTIVWPTACLNDAGSRDESLSDDMRMALAHEVAHVMRQDLLWNLLASCVHSFLFFHPLMWSARIRYTASQESECDRLAVSRLSISRAKFAELLIRIASAVPRRRRTVYAAAFISARPSDLLKERLTNMKLISQTGRSRLAAWLVVLPAAVALTPWSFAQTETKQRDRKSALTKPRDYSQPQPSGGTVTAHSFGSAGAFGSSSGGAFGSGSGSSGGFGGGNGSSGGFAVVGGGVSIGGPQTQVSPGQSSASGGNRPSTSQTSTQSSFGGNGNNISLSREVDEDGELLRVAVQERNRDILIRRSDADGIHVTIQERKKGSKKEPIDVSADTEEELKEKNAEAYSVYRKYLVANLKRLRGMPAGGGNMAGFNGGDAGGFAGGLANGFGDAGAGGGGIAGGGNNAAQEMLRQQLTEMLNSGNVDENSRKMIEQVLGQLPQQ
ncbi:MAG: M56 family metallopeptidase [Pirellulales bacterium]